MSILRFGIWACCLACMSVSAADLSAVANEDWRGSVRSDSLVDGTVLTEYSGYTEDERALGAELRVGFIPRFACEPIITVEIQLGPLKVSARQAEKDTVSQDTRTFTVIRAIDHFDTVEFSIDRTPTDFPILIDEDGPVASLAYHGTRADRIRLRLRIDVSNRMSVITAAGEEFDFSLLGSRVTCASASGNELGNAARQYGIGVVSPIR